MNSGARAGLHFPGRKTDCHYDWSKVPAAVRDNITFPPFPPEHLDNSLANLGRLAAVKSTT